MRKPTKLNLFVLLFGTLMTIVFSISGLFYGSDTIADLAILMLVCIVFILNSIASVKAYIQQNENLSEIEAPINFPRIVTFTTLFIVLVFSGYKVIFYSEPIFHKSNYDAMALFLIYLGLLLGSAFSFVNGLLRVIEEKKILSIKSS